VEQPLAAEDLASGPRSWADNRALDCSNTRSPAGLGPRSTVGVVHVASRSRRPSSGFRRFRRRSCGPRRPLASICTTTVSPTTRAKSPCPRRCASRGVRRPGLAARLSSHRDRNRPVIRRVEGEHPLSVAGRVEIATRRTDCRPCCRWPRAGAATGAFRCASRASKCSRSCWGRWRRLRTPARHDNRARRSRARQRRLPRQILRRGQTDGHAFFTATAGVVRAAELAPIGAGQGGHKSGRNRQVIVRRAFAASSSSSSLALRREHRPAGQIHDAELEIPNPGQSGVISFWQTFTRITFCPGGVRRG